ncbi:hypothetical protein COHA_010477 [Chlorella ohadii]|uniref:Uncharacterized protein n=1 Tax=Chlorella ohadii TaxID=2649997 RepID=A0AAD5DHP2_9CHLO|nr:hypothetical protein COHA_010477 [Chlorella ohadii]
MAPKFTIAWQQCAADIGAAFVLFGTTGEPDALRPHDTSSRLAFIRSNPYLQSLYAQLEPQGWAQEAWERETDRRLLSQLNRKARQLEERGIAGIPDGTAQPGRDDHGRFAAAAELPLLYAVFGALEGASGAVCSKCAAALERVKEAIGATPGGLDLRDRSVRARMTTPEGVLESDRQVYWILRSLRNPGTPLPSFDEQLAKCVEQPGPRTCKGRALAGIQEIIELLCVEEHLLAWMRNFPEAKRCRFFVHSAFLRYYRAGEPGNLFELHIDDSMYTVVICFPPWDHKAAGKTVVWDPRGERMQEWARLEGDKEALAAAVKQLPPPATVLMQPWDIMFMKNPVPHMGKG